MNNPPPVVADAQVQARLAAHGPPGNNPLTRAGRAHKRLKTASDAHASGTVTTPELGAHAAYATLESLLAAPNVPVPGQNGILAAIANLTNVVNAGFANTNANIASINTKLENSENRWKNSTALLNNDQVFAILLPNGNPPPLAPLNFALPNQPVTVSRFNALTSNELAALLNHYNLPANPQATRLARLRRHFGLPGV
jgi:hypothetical protein